MVGALYTGLAGWLMLGNDVRGNRILPGLTWRAFALVSAIPAVITLLCTIFVPESPKYLVAQGKSDKAVCISTCGTVSFLN